MMSTRKNCLLLLLCGSLACCATYKPNPLNTHSTLPDHIPHIAIDPKQMPLPELAAHRFDPSDGLDMTEVAMLAVVNNPDLKIARDDAGISRAQAFSAGFLPNPQLTFSQDITNTGGAGATKAFNFGLSYDFGSLLLHSSTRSAAEADARKTDLNLLWQEWQVVSQARLLFVRLTQAKKLMAILEQNRALFADRYKRTQLALDQGLLAIDAVTPNLTALQDVNKQINDLERQVNQNRHDLNALLGISPEVNVPLQGDVTLPALDEAAIKAILPNLARRRPDLIGLEAGYQAEDFRYRAAILAQFPALNIGLNRARDSSAIYSTGIGITLSLPIFNHNQGNIAIEEATRQKLHDDYQQRLNTGTSDIHRLMNEQRINARQLAAVNQSVAELTVVADKAKTAFQTNNIDMLAFANLQSSLLSKQIEQTNLQQSILEQRVALQTLIGGELPVQSLHAGSTP
jgi:outer membrane protein TolC